MNRIVSCAFALLVASIVHAEDESLTDSRTPCDPAAFEFLIGQHSSVLEDVITPDEMRILGENAPMTMDHLPNRLNVFHDVTGNIVKVSCG